MSSDTRDSRLLAVLNKLLDTSTTTVKRDLERHRGELTRNEFEDEEDVEEEEEDEAMDNEGSQNAQAEVNQSQMAVSVVPQSNEGSQGRRSGKKRKL